MAPSAINGVSAHGQVNGLSNGDGHHDSVNGLPIRVASNGETNGYTNGDANGYTNGTHTNSVTSNDTSDEQLLGHANGHRVGQAVGPAVQQIQTLPPYQVPIVKQEPIAIVGLSCRLPGNVATPGEFWELCARARSGYSEIPKERFDTSSFQHPNPGKAGCANPVGGHFLNVDFRKFDAPFFSLTEKEAISMDPQQRLLLEGTFEALENAGIPKGDIVGKNVGVFVGGSFPEYESHLFRDTDTIPMHQATG